MTVDSSPQTERHTPKGAEVKLTPPSNRTQSQSICFVQLGRIMPMEGEKLWSYVSEVFEVVKQTEELFSRLRIAFS